MSALQGKIALVTGVGRSEGIGVAICRRLAQEGADIFYTYWNHYDVQAFPDTNHRPEDFAKELEALGVRAAGVEMDLSKANSPHELFEEVNQKLGVPSILINNACYDVAVPFTELTSEILDAHYFVNLRATTLLCVGFVKSAVKDGRIINLTSGQSLGLMNIDQISYTTTKAGLEMLTKQLAPGIVDLGININAVDPGPTDTGWMSPDLKKKIQEESVVNSPEVVANEVISILLGGSTGQVIHVGR